MRVYAKCSISVVRGHILEKRSETDAASRSRDAGAKSMRVENARDIEGSRATSYGGSETVKLGTSSTSVLTALGYSLLICVMGVSVFGADPHLMPCPSLPSTLWQGAFLTGFALVHLMSYLRLSDAMRVRAGTSLYASIAVVISLPGALLWSFPTCIAFASTLGWNAMLLAAIIIVAALLLGCSCAMIMLAWSTIWAAVAKVRNGADAVFSVSQGTAAAILLALLPTMLMLFAPSFVRGIIAVGALTGSLALHSICLKMTSDHAETCDLPSADSHTVLNATPANAQTPSSAMSNVAHATSDIASADARPSVADAKASLLTRASFTSATTGLVFGACFYAVVELFGMPSSLLISSVSAVVSCVAAIANAQIKRSLPRVPEIEHMVYLTFVATSIIMGIALVGALPLWVSAVSLTMLLSVLFAYHIFNPRTVALVSLRSENRSMLYCSRENAVSLASTAILWLILLVLSICGAEPQIPLAAAAAICMLAIAAEPLFTPYITFTALEHLLDEDPGSTALSATDSRQPKDGKDHAAGEPSNDTLDPDGTWKLRCINICGRYELSPRETEVFMLLARGRTADYIAEELFISPHTVRTHIYRIYRKLGINDRQELHNIVEGRR